MSYDDGNEKHDCQLFGLHFSATHEEQRRIWMRLSTTKESREWGIVRNLMNLVVAPVPMPVHDSLAERMEAADQAMTKLAARMIDELVKSLENNQ